MARTGTTASHFSDDLFLAFSTANPGAFTPGFRTLYPRAGRYDELRFIPWGLPRSLLRGPVQATEEAVINALVANEEMIGIHGHRTPALPRDRVAQFLQVTWYALFKTEPAGRTVLRVCNGVPC